MPQYDDQEDPPVHDNVDLSATIRPLTSLMDWLRLARCAPTIRASR